MEALATGMAAQSHGVSQPTSKRSRFKVTESPATGNARDRYTLDETPGK